jgi:pyruvate formate lyase activating enzyme
VMSIDDVVKEATKDWAFYQSSNGGVTFSGGEPLIQAAFAERLAEKLKALYFNLAIETCGYVYWQDGKKVLEKMDQILYDVKHMDSEKHRKFTGVDNKLILDNAKKCVELGKSLIIRIPVVGGVNDDEDNIDKTAAFASEIGVQEIHLLPYHRYGESKYEKLGIDYTFKGYTPSEEHLDRLLEIIQARGIRAKTGG